MTQIAQEIKEVIIKKALGKKGVELRELAAKYNIGYSSLSKWLRKYRNTEISQKMPANGKPISRIERIQHVLATSALNDEALGAYCREQGLYAIQLQDWKKELMTANIDQKNQAQVAELKALRLENSELKQDIRRKEKALAETAALLILKKKANLIWGDLEVV